MAEPPSKAYRGGAVGRFEAKSVRYGEFFTLSGGA